MKYIYSILVWALLLCVGTSCEDDYRDMALFEGVEPIYQIGTCNNLTSSVSLYLTNPEGIVLGIDGGTGDYVLENSDNAVATVDFTESVNGYQRIKVLPKMEGQALVTVKDGSGLSTMLQVIVKKHVSHILRTVTEGFVMADGNIPDNEWRDIQKELENNFTVKLNGYYEFIATNAAEGVWSTAGKLLVYPTGTETKPIEGTFEPVVYEGESSYSIRLCYNGEEHIFTPKNPIETVTRETGPVSFTMWEEVTPLIPAEALPQGCRVFHGERWAE